MRLLLIGAFSYPQSLGSQVYFQEQAIALRAAGAEVDLLTYGARRDSTEGDGEAEGEGDPDRWRALDGFAHFTIPGLGLEGPDCRIPRGGTLFTRTRPAGLRVLVIRYAACIASRPPILAPTNATGFASPGIQESTCNT